MFFYSDGNPCRCVSPMCALNVWHCGTGQTAFAVRDWLRVKIQEQPAVSTHRQSLRVDEMCFTTPVPISSHRLRCCFYLFLSIKTYRQWLIFRSICLRFLPFSVHASPSSSLTFSFPSAQSHHAGSLFLANLFLIHYWGLFFFLASQNKEREQIFCIFNAFDEKCIISHFSTIRTGKLLAGHNTPSHEMVWDRERKFQQWDLSYMDMVEGRETYCRLTLYFS